MVNNLELTHDFFQDALLPPDVYIFSNEYEGGMNPISAAQVTADELLTYRVSDPFVEG